MEVQENKVNDVLIPTSYLLFDLFCINACLIPSKKLETGDCWDQTLFIDDVNTDCTAM